MTEKEIEKQLQRLYDPEGKYRINQKYSSSDKHVYTQEGDKYHWLTISHTGRNMYNVTKTDASGLITMRDNYQSAGDSLRCISEERLVIKQGRSALELLRDSKREVERTTTIGRNKPKNKGDRSL